MSIVMHISLAANAKSQSGSCQYYPKSIFLYYGILIWNNWPSAIKNHKVRKESTMHIRDKFLVVLMVFILVFSIYSLTKINRLQEDIAYLSSSLHGQISSLSHQISSANYLITELTREQERVMNWDFTVDMENSSWDQVDLNLDFTLREVQSGQDVRVFYRDENGQEWINVEPQDLGGNSYRAVLTVSQQYEYQYKIMAGNRVELERSIPVSHYVSMPVFAEMGLSGTSKNAVLELYLFQPGPALNRPTRINLYYYNQERLVKTEAIYAGEAFTGEPPWQGPHYFPFNENFSRIDLEVVYQDGRVDKGEIWPGIEYLENIKSIY